MKILFFLFFTFLFTVFTVSSFGQIPEADEWKFYPPKQKNDTIINSRIKEGRVEIIMDEKLKKLVSKHIHNNDSLGTIPGYRLQLFFASGVNSRKLAQEVESDFIKKYPDSNAYLIWDSPNYKVRVGDFRTRLDALKFQEEIKINFPSSYIVQDEINLLKM